jgi:hypothetical protein
MRQNDAVFGEWTVDRGPVATLHARAKSFPRMFIRGREARAATDNCVVTCCLAPVSLACLARDGFKTRLTDGARGEQP